jgi:gas vesicle protein
MIMGRFSKGMMAGILIGVAVEMAVMPQFDRKTQRTMRRAGRRMKDVAESTYNGIQDWMR